MQYSSLTDSVIIELLRLPQQPGREECVSQLQFHIWGVSAVTWPDTPGEPGRDNVVRYEI